MFFSLDTQYLISLIHLTDNKQTDKNETSNGEAYSPQVKGNQKWYY